MNDIIASIKCYYLMKNCSYFREMKANALASHLRPIVNPLSPSPVKTPFIFSTLHKGPRKTKKANPGKVVVYSIF